MFHALNIWDPFGDDRTANQAALDALQTAADLAAARAVYETIPAGQLNAEHAQRELHDRLAGELDAFADRGGVDRALFRETLQRKLKRDIGGAPDLSPLPARAPYDDDRRALEGAVLSAEHKAADAVRHLSTANRRIERCGCQRLLERRQRETRDATAALANARLALEAHDLARSLPA